MIFSQLCPCGDDIFHEHGATFYVSVYDREGNGGRGRHGLLVGPFTTHAEALRFLEPAKRKAESISEWNFFYAYGTLAMKDGYNKPGLFNKYILGE